MAMDPSGGRGVYPRRGVNLGLARALSSPRVHSSPPAHQSRLRAPRWEVPAAHWDEPDQWPIFPCMSRDGYGAQGSVRVSVGDAITTTLYMNADHSGLYRYELACGEQATNELFNAAGADLTPWLALHPSKELDPAALPLPAGREVGRTRAETDAYYARTVCTAATCPYRMNGGTNGNVVVHELGSAGCGPVPSAGTAQTIGPPVDASSPPQCYIEDTFSIPASTTCRGAATLRWMWNSAEGLETYASCLDLLIEASAEAGGEDDGAGPGGGGSSGGEDGGGAGGGVASGEAANGASGGGANGPILGAVVVALLAAGGVAAGVCWWRSKRNGAAARSRRRSEDPAWMAEPAPPPPAPPSAQPAPPSLPAGWTQVADPKSGRNYYHNQATGEVTWHYPAAAGATVDVEMKHV